MAEVAGLTASIIAIAGAAGTAVKSLETFKSLHDRHDEVEGIINEISDLNAVLLEVGSVVRQVNTPFPESQITALGQILDRAKKKLLRLETLLHYRLLQSPNTSGQVKARKVPWLTEKLRLKTHQDGLASVRLSLAALLSTMNISGSARIAMMVNEVTVVTRDIQNDQEDFRQQAAERFTKQDAALAQIFESFRRYQTITDAQGQLQDEHDRRCRDYTRGSSVSGDTLLPDEISSSSGGLSPSSDEDTTITYEVARSRESSFTLQSGLRVQTTMFEQNSCGPECSCICHVRNKLRFGNRLGGFLGNLFIGYSGSLANSQPCNERTCRQRSKRSTQFTYYFPSWFLARMFSLMVLYGPWDGPEISLRFPKIISVDATIMEYARRGNVDGMKRLFSKGLASPHDVSSLNGYTVLHYAASNRHSEACRFLLKAGADPYLQNDFQNCAIDFAWDHVFRGASSNQDPLVKIFYNVEVLETRQFSFIHKIVLGITQYNRNLKLELHESTSTLDAVDSQGRTAISWAAQRGDITAVETLLEKQADPSISDVRRRSALHYAAKASSPGCLSSILAAPGVDVNQRNIWQQTALHSACHNQKNRICIDLLMEFGADASARDIYGKTPMCFAAEKDSELGVAALLEHSANIEDRDNKGWTAIYWAMTSNSLLALRLLLARGASYTVKSYDNETLLHAVVSTIGIKPETVHLLTESKLDGLDVNAIDHKGHTARGLLSRRDDLSSDLGDALETLLKSLNQRVVEKATSGVPVLETPKPPELAQVHEYKLEPVDWRLGVF
ncbi:MAG: hypothetical protein M1836_005595 [Candelina mexicana]|nr:MAG: hypothetical protein M1836_005595 [Candelina mexicana]